MVVAVVVVEEEVSVLHLEVEEEVVEEVVVEEGEALQTLVL